LYIGQSAGLAVSASVAAVTAIAPVTASTTVAVGPATAVTATSTTATVTTAAAAAVTTTAVTATGATSPAAAWTRSTAVAAPTAGAASAVPATSATARSATALAGLCLVHPELAPTEVLPIEGGDRRASGLVLHLDESEAAWAAGFPIDQEVAGDDFTVLRKELRHFLLGRGKRQIPNVNPLAQASDTSSRSDAPARTQPTKWLASLRPAGIIRVARTGADREDLAEFRPAR
jgi:hypothetical protein